jgi:DNA repair exonuclease SbcCD ATPase subunit
MFAVFDLHHSIHGAQSNLLVLDEPDDGLDGAGVRYLINIINNELSAKFETVLVISHEDKLKDVFPRQITIERIDRLSHIRESR